MKTFKDNTGRTWTVSANVDAIKRVRSALEGNLLTEPACYHLTHRCQERRVLLKCALDRRNCVRRLRQMVAGYRVSVLDYMVPCNHVHLLLWVRRGGTLRRRCISCRGTRRGTTTGARDARAPSGGGGTTRR
jgi:hypothetical protein